MSSYIGSFARMEKKYVLNRDEMRRFLCAISSKIEEDEYPRSTINSIYFDTEDNKLINKSQEKPYYKEKLRLRTYTGIVHEQTEAFAEIKKKVNGIVYKRRTAGEYGSLFKWLCGTTEAPDSEQITREIAYLLQFYGQMRPSMQIVYRRESYVAVEDHDLRITFDTDVIWRNWSLETDGNAYGFRLLPEETVLMEVKASGKTIPLWLVREIEKHDIRPSSISKYGEAFNLTRTLGQSSTNRYYGKERLKKYV